LQEDKKIPSSVKDNYQSNYEDFNDERLFKAIANNDLDALSYAYQRYYNGLYFYGLKCTYRVPLIEDSIHDLFLKLWDKRSDIKIKQAFKPYLFKMFRSIIVDRLNKLNKTGELQQPDELLAPSLSVQDIIINREFESEQLRQLDLALKGLSSRQAEVIYLRFYEGLSYEQIAEAVDINYQSVRNSIYESVKFLKSAVKTIILISISFIIWQ